MLALLFLCSFLDRTNVGNAKILGLEKDLGISDHQYDTGLAIFYAFYIARLVYLRLLMVLCSSPASQRVAQQPRLEESFTENMAPLSGLLVGCDCHVLGLCPKLWKLHGRARSTGCS